MERVKLTTDSVLLITSQIKLFFELKNKKPKQPFRKNENQ